VLAYADRRDASAAETDRLASLKSGEVTRIDENVKSVSSDEALKDSSEPRTAVAAPSSAAARMDAPVATTGSSAMAAPKPARKHLPRTASELPLMALLASLSLAGGFGVRLARKAL
jgi:hypothetical protein